MDQIDFSPKTYVVMGMHRSGTSFLAKCLHRMGVNMGEVHDFEPFTLYEDKHMGHLGHELLDGMDACWDVPPEENKVLDFSRSGFSEKEIERIIEFRRNYANSQKQPRKTWGWKDPRTALLWPFYKKHMRDDTYLVCIFRKKDRVINSLSKRGGTDPEKAGKLYDIYNDRIIKHIKEFIR